ncbi:MAG: acetylxylan esterase [Lentisphaerae bacterium]|nr:acetylxylan esterase [Lentisphaerota bacterium]
MTIEHNFEFDPTNGMSQTELLATAPGVPPEGFEDFWQTHYEQVTAKKVEYTVEAELWSPRSNEKIYRVRVRNYDGVEFVMFVARPENSCGGLVVGQGYGNPGMPNLSLYGLTTAFACVRGLGFSQCRDIPWQVNEHVLHGIADKYTYILYGVIADQWTTASVLLDMFPDTAANLNYTGASMGGGMGALLLPWDKRFKAAYLNVPTFGAEIRFEHQSIGSGEACRKYIAEHPEAREVLAWFDASAAAKYITIPVCVAPALFDPCVAPAGQFSVANAIADEYKTQFIRDVGHFAPTGHDKKVNEDIELWCKTKFAR